MTESISRVLSKGEPFVRLSILSADRPTLHATFEVLSGGYGAFAPPLAVLLRIGFTWPWRLRHAGELLPRLSILTDKGRRFISVALSLKSPSADVICYPCHTEPGLSSQIAFRRHCATVRLGHIFSICIILHKFNFVKHIAKIKY